MFPDSSILTQSTVAPGIRLSYGYQITIFLGPASSLTANVVTVSVYGPVSIPAVLVLHIIVWSRSILFVNTSWLVP